MRAPCAVGQDRRRRPLLRAAGMNRAPCTRAPGSAANRWPLAHRAAVHRQAGDPRLLPAGAVRPRSLSVCPRFGSGGRAPDPAAQFEALTTSLAGVSTLGRSPEAARPGGSSRRPPAPPSSPPCAAAVPDVSTGSSSVTTRRISDRRRERRWRRWRSPCPRNSRRRGFGLSAVPVLPPTDSPAPRRSWRCRARRPRAASRAPRPRSRDTTRGPGRGPDPGAAASARPACRRSASEA